MSNVVGCVLPVFLALAVSAPAQTLHLYTEPDRAAAGGLTGKVDRALTHALALNHDHVGCYRAQLASDGMSFAFTGLPTGKYDLILVARGDVVCEGVNLGEDAGKVTGAARSNLDERVAKADTFFNKAFLHRFGLTDNGENLWAFIERVRDKTILKGSAEQLKANLRRFEVTEFTRSADDWTMVNARQVYREEAPLGEGMNFAAHHFVPELGKIRVIDSVKDLGKISLPH